MPSLGAWEWLIIAAIILLLFGAKRMPDAARGLGRSLRIFKAETKGLAGPESSSAGEIDAAGPSSAESPSVTETPIPRERSED
jgi:sec-independent protein translocase protein TatA